MARMGAYVASSPISTLWMGGAWAGLIILLPMLALVTGVTKRKNNRWCPKAMKACLAELSEAAHFMSGLPVKMRATCEKWGVPRTTVKRYYEASKQAVTTAPPGRPRLLTSEEEEQVVETILRHHKNGCALNHFQVKWLLMEIVRHVPGKKDTEQGKQWLKHDTPSQAWFRAFLNRHHDRIRSRVSQNLDPKRWKVTVKDCRSLYDVLEKIHDEYPGLPA